jgi:putative spermidine/putrescine transport system ATP-binding protein
MRRLERETIARKVKAALAMVELSGLEDRYPGQLSGGQQQRVALARAIVIEPRVLLCDEPLGALDKKLRQQMQFELKQLQKSLGVTLVFVTHDQEEALAMSDRIAVMNGGRVEQIGTPIEIYDQPETRFVADFIGDTNIFRGERVTNATVPSLAVGNGLTLALPSSAPIGTGVLSVALRPEKIGLSPAGDAGRATADACAQGIIESTNFLGGAMLYRIALESGHHILAQQPNAGAVRLFAPGNTVMLDWKPSDLVVLKD